MDRQDHKRQTNEITMSAQGNVRDMTSQQNVRGMTSQQSAIRQDILNLREDVQQDAQRIATVEEALHTARKDIETIYAQQETTRQEAQVTTSNRKRKYDETVVCENRPAIMLETLNAWRNERISVTKSIFAAKEQIYTQSCACVIGVPGAGKSTAVHHCAVWLEREHEFTIYNIDTLDEFNIYFEKDKKQVFVFDDALGVYTLSQDNVQMWIKYNEKVKNALGKNTKLLLSVRTQLFNHPTIKCKEFIFCDNSTNINFSDKRYRLDVQDMKKMLTDYLTIREVPNIDDLIRQIWPWSSSKTCIEFADCFPLLCRVFSNSETLRRNPRQFFMNPYQALTKIFENIKSEDNAQFCGLVLCAMSDDKLDEEILLRSGEGPMIEPGDELDPHFLDLRNCVMSMFKLKCPDNLKDIESALRSLDGIYVTYIANAYRMSHSVFKDIVTYLFHDPVLVFRYGTSEFIRDRVRVQPQSGDDRYVLEYTNDRNVERLADRLVKDLRSDAKRGAEFIASNPNIDDCRLISFLERKIFDRGQTNFDKKLIETLFIHCMKTVDRGTYNGGIVTLRRLISLCVRTGVDVNVTVSYDGAESYYPLHIAVQIGDFELTKLLLENGADKRRVDWLGYSVLHKIALTKLPNKTELMTMLLELRGDQSVVDMVAVTSDRQKILEKIEHYIDSNLRLEEVLSGNTISVLTNDRRKMKILVENYTGGNRLQLVRCLHDNMLTYQDRWGRNVLHYSTDDIVLKRYLLSLPEIRRCMVQRDRDGRTPGDYDNKNKGTCHGGIKVFI